MPETVNICRGKSENLCEVYFQLRNERGDTTSWNSQVWKWMWTKPSSPESNASEKRSEQNISQMRNLRSANAATWSSVETALLKHSFYVAHCRHFGKKQALLLPPACTWKARLQQRAGADIAARSAWTLLPLRLRAAGLISLVIPPRDISVLIVTALPKLAFCLSELLGPRCRIQEEFIS